MLKATLFMLLSASSALAYSHQYSYEIGRVYGSGSRLDVLEILVLTRMMIDSVLEGRMEDLEPHIDKEEGIYVDVRAHWSKENYSKDVRDRNGYISRFFISTAKLREYKKDEEALAVADELRKSSHYRIDFFFEGDECHVQIHPVENPNSSSNLNNPIFKKLRGKWYYLRLL